MTYDFIDKTVRKCSDGISKRKIIYKRGESQVNLGVAISKKKNFDLLDFEDFLTS
jgi:hypothetical protein